MKKLMVLKFIDSNLKTESHIATPFFGIIIAPFFGSSNFIVIHHRKKEATHYVQ